MVVRTNNWIRGLESKAAIRFTWRGKPRVRRPTRRLPSPELASGQVLVDIFGP